MVFRGGEEKGRSQEVTVACQVRTYWSDGEVRGNGEESRWGLLGFLVGLSQDIMGLKKPKGWKVLFVGLNEVKVNFINTDIGLEKGPVSRPKLGKASVSSGPLSAKPKVLVAPMEVLTSQKKLTTVCDFSGLFEPESQGYSAHSHIRLDRFLVSASW